MNASKTERREPASPDAILVALADEHRRAVLQSLNKADGHVMAFDVLVDRVADLVCTGVAERATDVQRHRVRIALHHTHLPKLEESRLIDYDTHTKQVRTVTGGIDQELLEIIESYETRE